MRLDAIAKVIRSKNAGPCLLTLDVLLADDPKEFAAAVVKLLRDENLARAIGARAAANVRARFGWERVATRFSELCESAIRLHSPQSNGPQAS